MQATSPSQLRKLCKQRPQGSYASYASNVPYLLPNITGWVQPRRWDDKDAANRRLLHVEVQRA